jgi:UDP-2,3-diacylglucosamine pyrophosphatase LpxH
MRNLLIVSDVHLACLRPGMREGGQREVARFIAHHADHPAPGGPWRLIVNGDLFDFDHQARSADERMLEPDALRLFGAIAEEFPEVFAALARFLDRGHEVVVIPGNHDLDLIWPGVRRDFLRRISAHLADPAAIGRLSFQDWFYYESGRIYVEHGHQYDVDNAVAGLLDPFEPGPRLRPSLGTFWIAGFCPHIPEIAYHVDHTRSPLYYLPVVAKRYGLRGPALWLRYLGFALRTLREAGPARAVVGPGHLERRRALAEASGLGEEALRRLEGAAATPRLASRLATAARLHIVPAFLLPVAAVFGILGAVFSSVALLACAAAALVPAVAVDFMVSSRFKGHAEESLRSAAATIQKIVGVPLVCFGHVHLPADERAGDGRYLNSGTWISARLPFHYIRVVGADAAVCRWEPRGGTVEEAEAA